MQSPAQSRSSVNPSVLLLARVGMLWIGVVSSISAQTIYTPNPNPNPSMVQPGIGTGPQVDIPQTNLTPVAPPATTYAPPPNTYGSFDPYASTPSPSSAPIPGINSSLGPGVTTIGPPTGGYPPAASSGSGLFGIFSQPAAPPMAPAGYGTPGLPPVDNPSVYGAPMYGAPTYGAPPPGTVYGSSPGFPSSVYPQSTPSSLFPEGFGSMYSEGFLQNPSTTYSAYRLLQGPRFRYGYVTPGDKPYHLGMNDFDLSVAFAFPNFLYMSQPFYVLPSFSLHLWDGPNGTTGADLPSKAYDAFVDLGWESDPNKMVGTEFGLRLGVFSDFDTYNSKSFRVRGRALVNFRVTPTSTFKGGVYYVNRNEIKLIPAAGLFCRPNPYTRIDLYFPQPKYARYFRTIGTYDLWWYLTGDYGGGNWTITRDDGDEDSVDINDLRAILGFEWGPNQSLAMGRRSGFAEVGYVFNREVRYRYEPADDFDPDDGFMFRVGIGY